MKILDIHSVITTRQLYDLLQEKLNPMFREQRQVDIGFVVEDKGNLVEISEPVLYEGFLFRIEPKGTQLHITRSEHYVDDVNSLTVESILNFLFEELAGNGEVTLVLEG